MSKFTRTIYEEKTYKSKDISTLKNGLYRLHPITTNLIDAREFKNPICLTKMHISNNKLNTYSNYICNGENKYKENITLPPIYLDSDDLLQIYDINDIDSLNLWIETNIDSYNITTINRVLNCWIEKNIDIIKIYNNFIYKIYINIVNKYINSNIQKKIDVDTEIKNYIKYWIEKYDKSNKNNLFNDIIKYINLKFDK
jgi:hypothetical protein